MPEAVRLPPRLVAAPGHGWRPPRDRTCLLLLNDLGLIELARQSADAAPPLAVDIDTVAGLAPDLAAVTFLVRRLGISIVITRRPAPAARALELGCLALLHVTPFLVGMAVAAIGMSYGANSGYAINPARDFGPRLFTAIAGWGSVALPGNGSGFNTCFWIPIIGPLVGGALGILAYGWFIRDVLISRGVPEAS